MTDTRSIDELKHEVLNAGIRPSMPSTSDDHIARQIERLERAQLAMERQLLDGQHSPVQRVRLQKKCDTLGDKADKLRAAMNQRVEDAQFGRRAGDSHRTLALRLRAFIGDESQNSQGDAPEDIARVQRWLALLIRERRAALDEVRERVQQARRYVLRATIQLDEIDSPDGGEASALEIRTHVGMAEEAVRDARNDLGLLAHHWSDLSPLASRRDWNALPFTRLKDELKRIADDPAFAEPHPELTETDDGAHEPALSTDLESKRRSQLNTLRDEFKATAIWLQELRTAVQSAPPPFESVASD